jgi:hypothetical protein
MKRRFLSDTNAVLDLPMRLTVSLIIGGIALAAILGYMLNPCLFPGRMIISVSPMVEGIDFGGPENIDFTVTVTDSEGRGVSQASVIIVGLGGIGHGSTDGSGTVTIEVANIMLEDGVFEGFLDVQVKAPCFESFSQRDMIKIYRQEP